MTSDKQLADLIFRDERISKEADRRRADRKEKLMRRIQIRKTKREGEAYAAELDRLLPGMPSRLIKKGCPAKHIDAWRKSKVWQEFLIKERIEAFASTPKRIA
jgi:hypothetical protein